MTSETLFYVIVGILVVDYIIETVLDVLNARKFSDPVPEELDDLYDGRGVPEIPTIQTDQL